MKQLYFFLLFMSAVYISAIAQNDAFIIETNIPNGQTFTIPTFGDGYNYTVDWGDGNTDTNVTRDISHTYSYQSTVVRLFEIKITGSFPQIYFNGTYNDSSRQLRINQWGTQPWRSMQRAFAGIASLIILADDTPNLSNVTDMSEMFSDIRNLSSLGRLSSWDTSNIENISGIFKNTRTQPNVTNWDVSKVTNASEAFSNSTFNGDLSNWDISSMENMTDLFSNSNLSATNYEKTLLGWATLDTGETQIPQNITIDADGVTYCDTSAKVILANDYRWTFKGAIHECNEEDKFISTWETTKVNEQITIPILGRRYYTVEWGDGEITTGHKFTASHIYNDPKEYTIKIYGNLDRVSFVNSIDREKIKSIDQWGAIQWTDMWKAFTRCSNLRVVATDAPDLSNTTRLEGMFQLCTSLETPDFSNWDTSTIENMKDMFNGATKFNGNISNWNTSNVAVFMRMFSDANSFNQDISSWDANKANNFFQMFYNASSFNQNIASWSIGKNSVFDVNFNEMFRGATAFDQSLASLDISEVTKMQEMFLDAGLSIENYEATLQGWATLSPGETKIPTDITFHGGNSNYCDQTARSILTTAPIGWTITDGGHDCPEEDKFITKWTVTADDLSIPIYMLGPNDNYTVDWGDDTIESGFTGSTSHTYDAPGTYTVKIYGDFSQMSFFNRDGKDKIIAIDQWGTNKWSDLIAAFSGCSNVKLYATDVPDLSEATNMVQAFQNATAFEDVNNSLKDWDVRTITNFSNSFEGTNMNSDISGWNMEAATEIINMFANNSVFNQPIGNWTFNNLEFSLGVFRNATSFNQDLSNWDVSKVRNFESMFNGATAFDQSLGDWDISSAQTGDFRGMDNMFENAGLSSANYDTTLLGWATLDAGETQIPTDIILDAGTSNYCISAYVRFILTSQNEWTITDGGLLCTEEDKFITKWETKSANEGIQFRTSGSGNRFSVDWGDGTTTEEGIRSHTYASPGIYEVTVSGAIGQLFANYQLVSDKMLSVEQWGAAKFRSFSKAFSGMDNVVINATDTPDLSNVTTFYEAFRNCKKLVDNGGQMQYWDVSNISDFTRAFEGATVFDTNLGGWDINNANSISGIFNNSGLSSTNYDAILEGWANNPNTPNDLQLGAAGVQYCAAEADRTFLDIDKNWGISDGGQGCNDDSTAFITTWETTSPDESITIPTTGPGYNYTIDWGDGTIENNKTTDAVHQYDNPKQYQIKIWGDFPRIYFSNLAVDKDKILSIDQWGTIKWTSMQNAFFGCSKLTISDDAGAPDLSKVTVLNNMFADTNINTTGNLNSWDVSNVRSFYRMFISCPNFNQPLDQWDVSNANSLRGIFHHAINFNQDISDWNVGKCTNFAQMFLTADDRIHLFNQDISGWNVGEFVTDTQNIEMYSMFKNAKNFNADLSNWDVSRVSNFNQMFYNTLSFDYNLGRWDISNATNMELMFGGVTLSKENYDNTLIGWATLNASETAIPIELTFDAGNSMYCFGAAAKELLTSDPYRWVITDGGRLACNTTDFFITTWETTSANESITIPTTGNGYHYDVDWGDGTASFGHTGNATHEYNSVKTYTVRIKGDFPRIYFNNTGDKAKIKSIEQWGNNPWASMEDAFNNCSNLELNAIDTPNLSGVTSLKNMFKNCKKLVDNGKQMDIWDVSSVTNMSSMFYSATIFDENITSWNVGKVTDFSNMFNRCAFNQPIGSWNIGEYATGTINMEGMFLGANSLFNQDISTWDMSKVASVKTMFLFNKDFDQPLGAWDISNMVDMSEMFFGAGLSSENYDTTLIGWATLTVGETQIPSGIALNAGTSQYCFGLEAKNFLTDDNGLNWTINDNGASCDLSDAFITTWETTMADENITIPTTGGGYNYTVDWGDGTIETGLTEDAIHVYKVAKTHTIKIMGDFPRFSSFKNLHSARQLRTVEQWGTIAWRTMDGAFLRCNNLRVLATDAPDLSNVTSLSQMFRNCSNLQSPDFSNWDTSNITNMGFMFTHATNFNGNISTWDVGKVVNFSTMLLGAVGFNQNISSWNIGEHVTGTITMNSMLIDTENFDQNLGAWNLEKVTDISGILNNSGISTTNYDATLIGWAANPNTPSALHLLAFNVTYCFGETARDTLTDPNGLNWSISDGGASCDLSEAFITTWNINNSNEEIVIPVPGTGLDFDVDWGDGTITNESEEAYHTYVTPGTYTIRVLGDFQQIRFNGNADRRKIQTIEQWGNNQWTSMESAFKGCSALEINATDAPDLSIVTSMVSMFENGACVDNGGNLGNWNTGAVLSMDSMFRNAYMLENINTWNVSSVQSIDYMFSSTEDFNEPLDQWDTSNLESAVGAFSSTKRFDQSLGDWDISKVTNFTDIFKGSIGFSTENYDATLKGWATLDQGETTIPTNVSFSDEGLTYCAAAFERNELDTTYQWNILENAESACENESAFITNWSITVGDQSIEIPTLGDGYLYTVDWGDGTVENGFTGNATHTYTLNIKTSHIIQVKITGSFPRIFFNNSGDKDKIRAINQWGTQQWASMDSAFKGCANLKLRADDIPNLSQATSIQQMFASATAFSDEKDRMGQWDVSSIKNMFGTFRNTSVFNEDISNWTTTSVENIGSMFENANSFNQDISRWDVSNLSRAIEINGFYLGSLTTTFSNTSFSDANYDRLLMGWFTDTSGVSNDGIDDVPDLQALNIDNSYCTGSIARNHLIETHNWVINDEGESCTDAFITKWSVGAGEDIIIPVFDVFIAHDYNVDWGDGTFSSDVTSTISHTYTSAGTYTVKVTGNMPSIFYGNNIDPSIKARLQTIEQWGTQKWSHLSTSFAGCTNLKLNAIDSPDLSGIRSLSSMFSGCTNLEDLKDQIGNWDMSTITDTTGIFENCNLFNENVANWDISKVEFMSDILTNTGMSQENYDATLIGWATLDNGETQIPTDITLDANATYCLAEGARTLLTSDTYKWTINDGGLRCTEKAAINVYLLGAALNPKSGEEQLMRDDLRSTAVMPSTSPYSDAIKTSESVLDNTSNAGDTIVDWVWVELRDPNDSTILIEGRSALLQRDGDVVDIDGVSPISFEADSGAYYVVVNHRNHLAIRSKDPIIFDSVPVPIDFSSSPSTIEGGLNAVTQLANGKYAIYAGDVDGNGQTQNSDINILSGSLGSSGYQAGDADMNGQIQNTDINSIVVPCIGKAEQF